MAWGLHVISAWLSVADPFLCETLHCVEIPPFWRTFFTSLHVVGKRGALSSPRAEAESAAVTAGPSAWGGTAFKLLWFPRLSRG